MNKILKTITIVVVGIPIAFVVCNFGKGYIEGFKKGFNESIDKEEEA